MDQEIKARWIEALTSGVFKQGRYALRNNRNQFCCLGVLCEIVREEEHLELSQEYLGSSYSYAGNRGRLPRKISDKYGLSDSGALPKPALYVDEYNNFANDLATLNDRGMPFAEIAEVIKEQF